MNIIGQGTALSIIPTALAVAAVVFLAVFAVVGIFVIIVVANRAEPDPSGRRPLAVYLFGVSFLSLFVVLFGTFAMVLGLVQLMGRHPGVAGPGTHPVGDAVTRVVVLGGIIVVIAAVLLRTHLTRALSLPEGVPGHSGPVDRVAQSYAASVSFASVFIAAVSLFVFLYEVLRILAPGVFELSGSRIDAARVVVAALYLAFAAAALVAVHRRMLPGTARAPRQLPPPAAPPADSAPPFSPSPSYPAPS